MKQDFFAVLVSVNIAFLLLITCALVGSVMAQSDNMTSENSNNTQRIVNMKDRTVSLINTTTNETISVKEFMPEAALNTTTNQNIITNASNATTNENLTPENTTTNETLTANTENATNNVNLTAKFNSLQGK
jgi:hypothetical protein